MKGDAPKDLNCLCGRTLGKRRGNTLIASGFEVEIKRTHDLVCRCGRATVFLVNRRITRDCGKNPIAPHG